MEKEVCRGFDAHSDELCMSGNTINMILFDFSYFPISQMWCTEQYPNKRRTRTQTENRKKEVIMQCAKGERGLVMEILYA